MTAQGSVYSQFKRALAGPEPAPGLDTGGGASEGSARGRLSLLLLALEQQPWRFETAAPRWHARLCAEARLTLAETQLAIAALDAMGGPGAIAGGQSLVSVCGAHGLDDAVGVLDAWLDART